MAYGISTSQRPRFIYQGGKTLQWDDSLQSYIEPYKAQTQTQTSSLGAGGGLGGPSGDQMPKLPGNLAALLQGSQSGGYQSIYEKQLADLLNRQMPQAAPNQYTSQVGSYANQLANFQPATTLPPAMLAELNKMKESSLAGVEKSATKASDALAGLLYQNTGGGAGSQSDFAKSSLAGEIGDLRKGVESDYASKVLNELNNYNQTRLSGLQGGISGLSSAAGLQEGAIGRDLGNFYNDVGFRSGILDRLLSSERDRQGSDRDMALQLLRLGYRL